MTAFIDRPPVAFAAATTFWLAVTGSTASPSRGADGEFSTLFPPGGDAYLRFQRIAGGVGGSHLDLHVDDPAAEADRLGALGATLVADHGTYFVLRSPGGVAFCLVGHRGETVVSPPTTTADGDRTRVDQLCLDLSPAHFDADCAFWPAATGWELRATRLDEFRFLARPVGAPFRLLLQRLGDDAARGHAGAHLDVSCSNADRVAAAHQRLGATVVAEHEWWITLTDPAGAPYCLLRRDPVTRR